MKHKTGIQWTPSDERRFLAYQIPLGVGDCWPWQGGTHPSGYGKFWLRGASIGAHVFAYALAHGGARPEVVRHTCDNPPCTNPWHLIGGSQHQNLMDARERGRVPTATRRTSARPPVAGKPYGQSIHTARLDEATVAEVRRIYAEGGESVRTLAIKFGISKSMAHNIVTGKAWAHV